MLGKFENLNNLELILKKIMAFIYTDYLQCLFYFCVIKGQFINGILLKL